VNLHTQVEGALPSRDAVPLPEEPHSNPYDASSNDQSDASDAETAVDKEMDEGSEEESESDDQSEGEVESQDYRDLLSKPLLKIFTARVLKRVDVTKKKVTKGRKDPTDI
jgi:nucleosome binding factor SPN SPT16 subunit